MHEHELIGHLPKCELHIHIEGSLEPELMFALARRNGVTLPYESVDALRRAYNFTQLQDFLDIYYQGMSVLITSQDFHDLMLLAGTDVNRPAGASDSCNRIRRRADDSRRARSESVAVDACLWQHKDR